MEFEQLKQRIAMHLTSRQNTAAVDQLIERHSFRHKDSPLYNVFPFPGTEHRFAPSSSTETTLVTLYSIEGVIDDVTHDNTIYILDRVTRDDFMSHVALDRPITFAMISGRGERNSAAVADGEESPSPWEILRIDVLPSAAAMSTYKAGMSILTRPSHFIARAQDMLDALDRGAVQVDAEEAVTNCCSWIVETLQLVDDHFTQLLHSGDAALQVVEAYMKRYTAVRSLLSMVQNPNGVFMRLTQKYVSPSCDTALQFQQRVAQLLLLTNELRQDALWCSVLSKGAMGLKFASPYRDQSLASLEELCPHVMRLVTFVFAVAGSCVSSSSLDNNGVVGLSAASRAFPFVQTLRQRFLPLVSLNVTQKCSAYLSLTTIFDASAIPDRDENPLDVVPLCMRPAILAKLDNASQLLLRLRDEYIRLGAALAAHFPITFYDTSKGGAPGDGDVFTSTLQYAAARCRDLVRISKDIDEVGCGLMTREALCLLQTVHIAANAFSMLEGTEYKNWQLFADVFDKSKTLKYTNVEPMDYQRNIGSSAPGFAAASRAAATAANTTTTRVGEDDTTDEEKKILRSRVTVLNTELTEARSLLFKANEQLKQTQEGLQQAQSLNVLLMQELRRYQQTAMTQSDSTTVRSALSSYDALLLALADNES